MCGNVVKQCSNFCKTHFIRWWTESKERKNEKITSVCACKLTANQLQWHLMQEFSVLSVKLKYFVVQICELLSINDFQKTGYVSRLSSSDNVILLSRSLLWFLLNGNLPLIIWPMSMGSCFRDKLQMKKNPKRRIGRK